MQRAIECAQSAGFRVKTWADDNSSFRVYSQDQTKWATIIVGHSGLVRWNTPGAEFRQFDTPTIAFRELKAAWRRMEKGQNP